MAVEKTKIPYHVSEGLWSAFPQFFARSNARWSGQARCRRRLAWRLASSSSLPARPARVATRRKIVGKALHSPSEP